MSIERNELFDLAFRFMTETQESVFLTGKAGTGKTTFLKYLREHSTKNLVVAAPTGVAAINAGGVTLHSLFQLPFHPFLPTAQGKAALQGNLRLSKQKLQLLRKMDVLVIDEISMVRCDLLDAIDTLLRSVRRQHNQPFGGVQLLCIGDLYQLPPVAPQADWALLQEHYNSPFFFDSLAIREQQPLLIELTKIYRQKEDSFVQLLNQVRNNDMSEAAFNLLHQRYVSGFRPGRNEGYITLTTHNHQADQINYRELEELPGAPFIYKAKTEGDFPENTYPADADLRLKTGAQVMFLKNDTEEKSYFNGKIGVVQELTESSIVVRCTDGLITVRKQTWSNIRYTVNRNTGVLEEEVLGTFEQYPLRLAWAVTIHKSQGLTFEKVLIDAAAAFSSGQVYVALSRCTSLEGIVLLSKIPPAALISNPAVVQGQKQMSPANGSLADRFTSARRLFTTQLLEETFDLNSVTRSLQRLQKSIQEQHSHINAEAPGWVQQVLQQCQEISTIARKFLPKTSELLLQESMVEQNPQLQERISAAANHFSPLLEALQQQIQKHPLVTEHKEAAVALDENLVALLQELHQVLHLQQYCKGSFSVPGFLRHKLKMLTPRFQYSCYAAQRSTSKESAGVPHPELYRILLSWRNAWCNEHSLPVYMVASTETLQWICQCLPLQKDDLLRIKGLGKAKVEKFGAELLELVQDYCGEYGLASNMDALLTVATERPKATGAARKKGESLDETLQLLQQGKTIAEIAGQRKLAVSTVEGHIQKLAANNKVDARRFVSEQQLLLLQEALQQQPTATIGVLKQSVGDALGFFELRLGLMLLQPQQEQVVPG